MRTFGRSRKPLPGPSIARNLIETSTGQQRVDWKPFCYLLEDAGFELMLVNARQVKNLPTPGSLEAPASMRTPRPRW